MDFGGKLHNAELGRFGSPVTRMRKLRQDLERGTDYKECDIMVCDLEQSWLMTIMIEGT
jgi:hypothetical protein